MVDQLSSNRSFAPDFRLGDWLVEPSLDRLSRNGTSVRLRPQLTDLLVFLAQRAGRTVSKEEILAGVWGRRFVGDSGVSRCIAEIRHALEEDARKPTLLETITKRGYRIVAPVVFVELDHGPADDAPAPNPHDGTGDAAILDRPQTAAQGTPRSETEPAPARPAPLPGRRRMWVRWALAWGSSLVAPIAATWGRRPGLGAG